MCLSWDDYFSFKCRFVSLFQNGGGGGGEEGGQGGGGDRVALFVKQQNMKSKNCLPCNKDRKSTDVYLSPPQPLNLGQ